MAKVELTEHQRELARARDAKRYRKDRKKRIAAVVAWQKKDKALHPEKYQQRAKVNNAVAAGKPVAGKKKPPGKYDFDHQDMRGAPSGHWEKESPHRRKSYPAKTRGSKK